MGLTINKYWRNYHISIGSNLINDTETTQGQVSNMAPRVRMAEEAIDVLLNAAQALTLNERLRTQSRWAFALLNVSLTRVWSGKRQIWFLDTHRCPDGQLARCINRPYGNGDVSVPLLRVNKDFSFSAGIVPFFDNARVYNSMKEEHTKLDKAMRQLHDYVADKIEFRKAFRHTA